MVCLPAWFRFYLGATPYQPVSMQPQQIQQNTQQNIPQQHQQHQPRTVYQPMQPPQTHHTVQQTQPHQTQESVPKKRTAIKIVDPNSGKDLTNDIKNLKKTEKQTTTPRSNQVKVKIHSVTSDLSCLWFG